VNNNYKIKLNSVNKNISIPIEIKWDYLDREDSIQEYQEVITKEVIGSPKDFEISRFAHEYYDGNSCTGNTTCTSINYEFYFYSGTPSYGTFTGATSGKWLPSYTAQTFTISDLYYQRRSFTNSFFKMDFYDTKNGVNQINYFTVIIPTSQGKTTEVSLSEYLPPQKIKKPIFKLDYFGDKEGFFLYWLRDKEFYKIDTFYMTAKFFDAKLGQFIRLMNRGQFDSSLKNFGNWWRFKDEDYFYNKVVLNYDNKTYQVFDINNQRIGTEEKPIKLYEYLNPLISPATGAT